MDTSMVITGCHLIEANSKKIFVPHLDNFYEQYLYENCEKSTGISHFYTNRFKSSGFKGHLDAVENCFDQLIKESGLYRKINKKRSSRIGVIYFDQYGPVSFFNQEAQIKEMYYSDVFPSFILNSHNISGYSVRLRAERSAFFQAIETAQTLIEDDVLDMVVIGGVYQCIPYLFLSDVMDDYQWLKDNNHLSGENQKELFLSDATGFVLLESSKSAQNRSAQILASVEAVECQSKNEKKEINEHYKNSAFSYSFIKQSNQNNAVNSLEYSPDLGCINPLRTLQNILQRKSEDSLEMINSIDRDGYAWSLKLDLKTSE